MNEFPMLLGDDFELSSLRAVAWGTHDEHSAPVSSDRQPYIAAASVFVSDGGGQENLV